MNGKLLVRPDANGIMEILTVKLNRKLTRGERRSDLQQMRLQSQWKIVYLDEENTDEGSAPTDTRLSPSLC